MRFFLALLTVLTIQLYHIQAKEVEEQNVEDKLIEMDVDLDDTDLEEDLDDSDLEEDLDWFDMEEEFDDYNAIDLRAKPPKRPFCIRTRHHPGWGGQCLHPTHLKNQSCDFIWGGEVEVKVNKKYETTCRHEDLYCCVDCYAKKQRDNCPRGIGNIKNVKRECCDGNHELFKMDSGCKCCGTCKRTAYCKKYKGWCVYKYGEDYDPVHNNRPNRYDTCVGPDFRIKYKWCDGKTCACCMRVKP